MDIDIFLFVFRLVVQVIIYILCYIGNVIFNLGGEYNRWLGKTFFWICNFNKFKVVGFERYKEMLESDKKFLIIANHVTIWDGFALMAALGDLGFVSSKKAALLLPGMTDLLYTFNSIIMDNKGRTTDYIINHVSKRKRGDNPLVIFADAMNPVPVERNIAPFKTGAFVGKFDILPVVIKYKNYTIDPTIRWYKGEDYIINTVKMLLDSHCDVHVEVLEPVSCGSLSVEQYRDKVYDIMNFNYGEI